ncbi:ABC transporter permease [Candidatus Aerophobetes bacterium]|mgnify:CR=1 FL=1|uniref:Transport permease protein n=1 Tax=Aerophobetes bacterium TaxID=2030807 RepID=A0A662D2U5_UNCAE|nr:MAG: ABC transporter permease [Candidatus Aerophobetes bacterium]
MKRSSYFKNIAWNLRCSMIVAEKDAKIYYIKPPVLIFGLLFPFFLFLAFVLGRQISLKMLIPGLVGMTLFFTSSSIGPIIYPWERNARTYERLISTPISLPFLLLGDTLAGFCYGILLSLIPLILGALLFEVTIIHPFLLTLTLLLASFCFSFLGILLSSPLAETPSQIMMLSALVRFPMIFISGVFISIDKMPLWGKMIALISPLTYTIDLIRYSFGRQNYYPLTLDFLLLGLFSLVFFVSAIVFHQRSLKKGI